MEGHEKGQDTISSAGRSRTLDPACRFELQGHPVASENARYAIVSIVHHATDPSFDSVAKSAPKYQNSFTCIPADVGFTPEQRTEKPVIPGLQSAVVTGPAGEEIYTDRYGRVKVQFHCKRKPTPTFRCGFELSRLPRVGGEAVCDGFERAVL